MNWQWWKTSAKLVFERRMNMFRIEVFMGKRKGWKMGINTYTQEQLPKRLEALEKVGIKCRVVPESVLLR